MNPDTLVALPPITAAQRQLLISVLASAARDSHPQERSARVIALAQALDLHHDATPVAPPCQSFSRAREAAPDYTVQA